MAGIDIVENENVLTTAVDLTKNGLKPKDAIHLACPIEAGYEYFLIDALGEVDAERFITLLHREPFDYTQWQKTLFSSADVFELSKRAMQNRNDQASSL